MVSDDDVRLPDSIIITLLSLSISHTRALLYNRTLGTKYENYIIPIVNPTELAHKLYK
ncbi:MAG: hypothetical protein H7331_05495 [Bacteroidia bacterium]|nr:hypothetical protein [Bacteroidia bacterium]